MARPNGGFLQAIDSEELAGAIAMVRHTVAVEDKELPGLHVERRPFVGRIFGDAEHHSSFRQIPQPPIRKDHERMVVAGVDIVETAGLQIEDWTAP